MTNQEQDLPLIADNIPEGAGVAVGASGPQTVGNVVFGTPVPAPNSQGIGTGVNRGTDFANNRKPELPIHVSEAILATLKNIEANLVGGNRPQPAIGVPVGLNLSLEKIGNSILFRGWSEGHNHQEVISQDAILDTVKQFVEKVFQNDA